MYNLTIYEVSDDGIGGVDGYHHFEYSVLPKVGQWLFLPNTDGDLEYVYKVIQIAIPLREKGKNDVEIYVVRFESRDQAEDVLYQLRQTFLNAPI